MGNGKGGRPTKYKSEYCHMVEVFFDVEPFAERLETEYHMNGEIKIERKLREPAPFPTFEGFAASIGVTSETLQEWKRVHPEFSVSYSRAQAKQRNILIVNGLLGGYNANFAKFVATSCCGMKEQNQDTSDGGKLDEIIDALRSAP